jgi:hypothetical protein
MNKAGELRNNSSGLEFIAQEEIPCSIYVREGVRLYDASMVSAGAWDSDPQREVLLVVLQAHCAVITVQNSRSP